MNKVIKAHIGILSGNIIYGLNYVIAKGVMPDYMTPRALIFIRIFCALIFFSFLWYFTIKEKIIKKDLMRFAFAALFGIAINQIMFFEGLNLTSPINASIIMTSVPIIVLIISFFILKEKITSNKIAGIIIGCSGAIFLILLNGEISFESSGFRGNLFVLINAISFGLYLILVKPLMKKYHPVTAMLVLFAFGFIWMLPFCTSQFISTDFTLIPFKIWMSILFVVFATTILAYFLIVSSLKYVSPVVTSIYIYCQPLIATVVALSFGKDKLGFVEIISAILIFSGVYLVSIKKTKKSKESI